MHKLHADHPAQAAGLVDVLLEPGDAGSWAFRRDPAVTLPRERAWRAGPVGVRALAPEAVLLFKSGGSRPPRPKDEADFARTLPGLGAEARAWLRLALERTAPGHAWLGRL